jgi:hypothetical protein
MSAALSGLDYRVEELGDFGKPTDEFGAVERTNEVTQS